MKRRPALKAEVTRPTGLSSQRVDTRPTSLYSQGVEFERKKGTSRPPRGAISAAFDGSSVQSSPISSAVAAPATAPSPAAPTPPAAEEGRRSSVGERILATADELFYREGIRAVGIQRVIDEAGIAKASLYAHYASKDDLVAACMERRGQAARAAMVAALDAAPDNPRAKLLALFDYQRQAVGDAAFRGCPVMKTHTELTEPDHPARRITAAHRQSLLELFARLVKEAGLRSPDYVAGALIVLFDGAVATTVVDGDPNATRYARLAAEQIIDAHLPKRPRRR
jgi:AcrR family transcriptional regulator